MHAGHLSHFNGWRRNAVTGSTGELGLNSCHRIDFEREREREREFDWQTYKQAKILNFHTHTKYLPFQMTFISVCGLCRNEAPPWNGKCAHERFVSSIDLSLTFGCSCGAFFQSALITYAHERANCHFCHWRTPGHFWANASERREEMWKPNNLYIVVTTVWLWNWNGCLFFLVGHFVKCNKCNISIIWCFRTLRLTILPLWITSFAFVSCSICVLAFCL